MLRKLFIIILFLSHGLIAYLFSFDAISIKFPGYVLGKNARSKDLK